MRSLRQSVSLRRDRTFLPFPSLFLQWIHLVLLLTIQALHLKLLIGSNIGVVRAQTSPSSSEPLPNGRRQEGSHGRKQDAAANSAHVGLLCGLHSPWETVEWTPALRAALQGEIVPRNSEGGEASHSATTPGLRVNTREYKDLAKPGAAGDSPGPINDEVGHRASKWTKPVAVVIGIYHDYKKVSS